MNEFDWVAAESEKEAKEYYEKETGFSKEEVEEGFEGEVSLQSKMYLSLDELPEEEMYKRQMDMRKLYGELCVGKTFEWVISHENITKPQIIASTEV